MENIRANYEDIKQNILNNINTINTNEGSFADVVVSPVSMELEKNYVLLKHLYANMFLDNLYSDDLDRRAKEYGIERKDGTKATGKVIIQALANTVVPTGFLVATGYGLNYLTTDELIFEVNGSKEVNIIAEGIGTKYNVSINAINTIPVSFNGIASVNNAVPTKGGTNIETDQQLLDRLLLRLRMPATSGNALHYKQWALEVAGIGDAKIFPLWDGPGTVKVVVIDSNKQPVTGSLITDVHDYIETVRPIGADVTVVSGTAKTINIKAVIILAEGYMLQSVIDSFKKDVEEYFKSIAFTLNYVSQAKIGTILLGTDGVIDYSELKLNNTSANILLADEEIPIIGTVELEV